MRIYVNRRRAWSGFSPGPLDVHRAGAGAKCNLTCLRCAGAERAAEQRWLRASPGSRTTVRQRRSGAGACGSWARRMRAARAPLPAPPGNPRRPRGDIGRLPRTRGTARTRLLQRGVGDSDAATNTGARLAGVSLPDARPTCVDATPRASSSPPPGTCAPRPSAARVLKPTAFAAQAGDLMGNRRCRRAAGAPPICWWNAIVRGASAIAPAPRPETVPSSAAAARGAWRTPGRLTSPGRRRRTSRRCAGDARIELAHGADPQRCARVHGGLAALLALALVEPARESRAM